MPNSVVSMQARAIRKVLKHHLKGKKSTERGHLYTFKEIQRDIRLLAISEKDVRDAVDTESFTNKYWFDIRSDMKGELGKVLWIIPKAKLYSKLSEFNIPEICHCVKDAKYDTMYKIKRMPLIFTSRMYAFGYINSLNLDGVVKAISWTEICDSYESIILDYVDEKHELPIFDITSFLIGQLINSIEE